MTISGSHWSHNNPLHLPAGIRLGEPSASRSPAAGERERQLYKECMKLIGCVVDGQGHSSQIGGALLRQYQTLSGLDLVAGTLNVKLEAPYFLPVSSMRLRASEWGGPHDVLLLACRVQGAPGVIIRTEPNNFGQGPVEPNILEVGSDRKLRAEFNLQSGSFVEVEVDS